MIGPDLRSVARFGKLYGLCGLFRGSENGRRCSLKDQSISVHAHDRMMECDVCVHEPQVTVAAAADTDLGFVNPCRRTQNCGVLAGLNEADSGHAALPVVEDDNDVDQQCHEQRHGQRHVNRAPLQH